MFITETFVKKKLNPLKFWTILHLTYIQFRDFMAASPYKFCKLFNMLKACRQSLNINYHIYAFETFNMATQTQHRPPLHLLQLERKRIVDIIHQRFVKESSIPLTN